MSHLNVLTRSMAASVLWGLASTAVFSNAIPQQITVGPEGSGAQLQVKASAQIAKMDPEIESIYPIIVAVSKVCEAPTPVITSGYELESAHMSNSLHYSRRAIDLRARNMDTLTASCMATKLSSRLGSSYYANFESFPSHPQRNHVHVEFDPR